MATGRPVFKDKVLERSACEIPGGNTGAQTRSETQ